MLYGVLVTMFGYIFGKGIMNIAGLITTADNSDISYYDWSES